MGSLVGTLVHVENIHVSGLGDEAAQQSVFEAVANRELASFLEVGTYRNYEHVERGRGGSHRMA